MNSFLYDIVSACLPLLILLFTMLISGGIMALYNIWKGRKK